MLKTTRVPITLFKDLVTSEGPYALTDVRMDIPSSRKIVISARANGPGNELMLMRSWVCTDKERLLCEKIEKPVTNGQFEWLAIHLKTNEAPKSATIQLESSGHQVQHVLSYEFRPEDRK